MFDPTFEVFSLRALFNFIMTVVSVFMFTIMFLCVEVSALNAEVITINDCKGEPLGECSLTHSSSIDIAIYLSGQRRVTLHSGDVTKKGKRLESHVLFKNVPEGTWQLCENGNTEVRMRRLECKSKSRSRGVMLGLSALLTAGALSIDSDSSSHAGGAEGTSDISEGIDNNESKETQEGSTLGGSVDSPGNLEQDIGISSDDCDQVFAATGCGGVPESIDASLFD